MDSHSNSFIQTITLKIRSASATTIITWTALITALVASTLSAFDICTGSGGCSAAAGYTLFGMKLGWGGTIFFTLLALLYALRRRLKTSIVFGLLCFGATGAELLFLIVQRYSIGHWCPTCLVIAAAVTVLTGTSLLTYFRTANHDWEKILSRTGIALTTISIGFLVALYGIEQPQAQVTGSLTAPATQKRLNEMDIWMGNQGSDIEVYFISDWYCSFCRKTEKSVEEMLPEVGKSAKYTFLDMPIHKESTGILPYHNSLLLHGKDKYAAGRKALLKVTTDGKIPAQTEILSALASVGIEHKEVSTPEIMSILDNTRMFCRAHAVKVTPSVVVLNSKIGASKVLSGTDDITSRKLMAAISAVKDAVPAKQ